MATACDPLAPNPKYTNLCKFKVAVTTDETPTRNNPEVVKDFQERSFEPLSLKA
jgi:hypothetical protein